MLQPRTEAGHLYVKLLHGLTTSRKLSLWTDEREAEACAELDALWDMMSADEQARVEDAVGSDRVFLRRASEFS